MGLYAKVISDKNEIYLKVRTLIDHKVTPYQEVIIADIFNQGKTLIMDNEVQTSYVDVIPYHEALIHPYQPLEHERMLILGCGEGCSIDVSLRRGWKHIDAIDIDGQALEMIDTHLSDWNNHVYKRQNEYNLLVDDGLSVLQCTPDQYYSYVVFDLTSQAIQDKKDLWVSEIHRVLMHNGLLTWQDGNQLSPSYLDETVRHYFKTTPTYKTMLGWRYGSCPKI